MIEADSLQPPTLADVRRAARHIEGQLPLPTPLVHSPALSELLDAHVSLKLETANPISAFKVRGGIHLIAELSDEHRRSGVVTASTGNHGQSIAYAAALFGVAARIYVPQGANPDKVASIERLGGQVIFAGRRYDDARLQAEEEAAERGTRYIHSANEPALIAGVGTAALEVLETQQPDTDVVIVPIGAGSGACGWITVRDGLEHPAEIWGAQSAQAPAVHDAWRSGELRERPNTTIADGLSTAIPFTLPLEILRRGLNEFVLVDDADISAAVLTLLRLAHVLAEPAGSCATAAACQEASRLRGKRIVIVVSGANITSDQLAALLNDAAPNAAP